MAILAQPRRKPIGGEAGVSANRTKLLRLFGYSFGPQIQIYYLVAAWTLIAVVAMYALTRTPLGRMCNAVRDNPERAEFIGASAIGSHGDHCSHRSRRL